jgi:hypothetical protein
MEKCTFKNLMGLGYDDLYSYDDNIIYSNSYTSDLSIIGFEDSAISQYDLIELTFE